jgi:putative ABC transport system substrate-binding protein
MIRIFSSGHQCLRSGNLKSAWVVILTVAFTACSSEASAQQSGKTPRMGFLWPEDRGNAARQAMSDALLQGLRGLGYAEGKNIALEYRYGEGKIDRFLDLAAELVNSKVDIIVSGGFEVTRAAKNATKTIPIVMIGVGPDPVETGLVESLAHPGGNVTGFTNLSTGISGKRLQLLKEAVPKIFRVAVLANPADESNLSVVKEAQAAARGLGIKVQALDIISTDSFESVFARLKKDRPHGLLLSGGPIINSNEKRIAEFALNARLPVMYTRKSAVELGGLMSYGVDPLDHYRRAAVYVDKILKGTKAADLPVQRPVAFEFVVNLKTAKQISVTIEPNVLVRADKVIR